ncbi:MAG: hypothetical protein KA538_13655 [Azonexus sp.]|jgi:hypothetical protein|nr:hypothetical protein [Azonexus sp.]
MQIDTFLARWRAAGGSERANYQLFIADLCAQVEVTTPKPACEDTRESAASGSANVSRANVKPRSGGQSHKAYVYERRAVFHRGDGSISPRQPYWKTPAARIKSTSTPNADDGSQSNWA